MTYAALRPLVVALAALTLVGCGGVGSSDDGNPIDDDRNPGVPYQNSRTMVTGEPYAPGDVTDDPDEGQIIRTRLLVMLSVDATLAWIDDFLDRYEASITSTVAGARSMGIRIPDPVTLNALDAVIAAMESEPFVEFVLKEHVAKLDVLPDNVMEGSSLDYNIISHQLAIGAAAAWNARQAITAEPNVIVYDNFGAGPAQLNNYLDVDVLSDVASVSTFVSDHGYHVAGILAGEFGGSGLEPGLVTGVFPGRSRMHVIDLQYNRTRADDHALVVQAAESMNGTVILNTSLSEPCECGNGNRCRSASEAARYALVWIDLVRGAGLENKVLQFTAAGNRENFCDDESSGFEVRDAATKGYYAAAALALDVEDNGVPVDPLNNVLVVENLIRNHAEDNTQSPASILCLNDYSFVNGHIGAIGTVVKSLSATGTKIFSGTSMATPQAAGLAAYLLAIKPELSPQEVRDIILETADVPGSTGSDFCSDWPTPAPAVNAYSAVLALDESTALGGSINDAPVRRAILDVADGNGNEASNGAFDEKDLEFFITRIDQGTAEFEMGENAVKHSRVDLNGDGFDGGNGRTRRFNLDIDYPPTYGTVTQLIEGDEIEFDENALTDTDILCYYAYSNLYTGSTQLRESLVGARCARGTMAVYVQYLRDQIAVPDSGVFSNCPETPALLTEERETFSIRPRQQIIPPSPYEVRPASQYWRPGDTDTEINLRSVSGNRRFQTGFDNGEPVCVDVPFSTETEFNATLEHDADDNRLNVDVQSRAESDCQPSADTGELFCATSLTQARWLAEFDYSLRTPLDLQLIVQLTCTATSDRVPADPDLPNPGSISDMTIAYATLRYDHTGERVSTGPAEVFACPETGIVNLDIDLDLAAPAVADTTDQIVIRVSASQEIFTPYLGGVAEQGSTTIENRMIGFVEVRPGD